MVNKFSLSLGNFLFKNAYPTRWQGLAQHTQKLQLLAFAAVAIILYLLLN